MRTNSLGELSGDRKAAILMVLLGQEAAGALLRNLPQEAVRTVAEQVAQLDEIDPELARTVLEEYFVEAVRPERHRGGADVARELLASANLSDEAQRQILGPEPAPVADALRPLLDAPAETLATVLASEHPQTAALVLLKLSPEKGGQVLAGMPEETRAKTVLRMTLLRRVGGEILDEVISSLSDRLQDPAATAGEDDGGDAITQTAEVLKNMRRSEVRTMLDTLAETEPERAEQLRGMVNTFETLSLANDRGIQELLRVVDTKTLALALKDEEPKLIEKFLANLSTRARGMLEEEMEFIESVREDDKNAAQKELMEQALKLESEDKLTFAEPGD